jgi:REP element-mobilizing transposase RayT
MPEYPHHRRSIRLQGFDYGQAGGYFVTIAAYQRLDLFGSQTGESVDLNTAGICVADYWQKLSGVFPVELDTWVLMPNHLHGVLFITEDKRESCRQLFGAPSGSLSAMIQNFKSVTTRLVNRIHHTPGQPVWQRNFYEHVVRDNRDLENIRRYILENPERHFLKENDSFPW